MKASDLLLFFFQDFRARSQKSDLDRLSQRASEREPRQRLLVCKGKEPKDKKKKKTKKKPRRHHRYMLYLYTQIGRRYVCIPDILTYGSQLPACFCYCEYVNKYLLVAKKALGCCKCHKQIPC